MCAIMCDLNRTATKLEGLFIVSGIKSSVLPVIYLPSGDDEVLLCFLH